MRFNCKRGLSQLWILFVAGGVQLVSILVYSQRSVIYGTNGEDIFVAPPIISNKSDAEYKGVVAYALSFTQCPPNNSMIEVLDAPAILAHSIHLNSYRNNKKSAYDYHLVAFVHPLAVNCTQHLPSLGFEVRVLHEPVEKEEIRDLPFQRWSEINACCGIREFMKLYAYVLEDYPVVVHLDADVLFLQPLDELYDAMQSNDMTAVSTLHPKNHERNHQFDFFYTRDYVLLNSMSTDPLTYAVQGGFFVLRPNLTIFSEMQEVIRKGNFGRRLGWDRKGYGGYWGGAQIQGFLSYFYGEFYPSRALELHPCVYSTLQGFDPIEPKSGTCRYGNNSYCPDCSLSNITDVKITHFTNCYKPWWCPKARVLKVCRDVLAAWFAMRRSFEESLQLTDLPSNETLLFDRFGGYCTDFKRENYIPMSLTGLNVVTSSYAV